MLGSRAGVVPVIGALLGVLVGGLMFTGCQTNPEPPPLETGSPSPSATPSTSPTEAAPTLPPEAEGADEAAAKAFVRHYVDLVNHAMRTGDTARLKQVALEGCDTCAAVTGRIDEVYGTGGRLEGDGWTIRSVTSVPTGDRKKPLVAVGIDIASQRTYESDTATPSRSPNSRGNLDFHLTRRASGWRISRLDATQ